MRVFCLVLAAFLLRAHGAFPTKQEVIENLKLANDYWIFRHRQTGDNRWNRAVYFEGLMALYEVYPDYTYYKYAESWAEDNSWSIRNPTDHADNQAAGQTYLDLHSYEPEDFKIEEIKQSVDDMVASSEADDWWWIDALQMAMPVFTRLGVLYNDTAYFDKMYDLYDHTKSIEGGRGLYSDNGFYTFGDYLWWRDQDFDPPRLSPNNKQVYWSRGNGWVIAALVRTLELLPKSDPHYDEYVETFKNMSMSLKDRITSSGFWSVNIDDPDHAKTMDSRYTDVPETSGTAFFTYAFAWGINNGHLTDGTYRPLVETAWNVMVNTSLQSNGRVGWVQGVGLRPGSSQPVRSDDTEDFGVGAFLLAGTQVLKMASGLRPKPTYSSDESNDALVFLRPSRSNPGYSGDVVIRFVVTPQADNMDGVVLFSASSQQGRTFSRASMLVRMSPSGTFDCRNGSLYASDANVSYSAGGSYDVRVVGALDTQTYDVFVASGGSPEVQIADNFLFRDTAPPAADIGKMAAVTPTGAYTLSNIRVNDAAAETPTVSPTVNPTATEAPTQLPSETQLPSASSTVGTESPSFVPSVGPTQFPTPYPTRFSQGGTMFPSQFPSAFNLKR